MDDVGAVDRYRGGVVSFVTSRLKHDFHFASRRDDPDEQMVGLDSGYRLQECVPSERVGRQVLTFVLEALSQERITGHVTLTNGNGSRKQQLLRRIHDILPTEGGAGGRGAEEASPVDTFVARVVHLGLERFCSGRGLIEDLRLSDNDLSDMRAVIQRWNQLQQESDPNHTSQTAPDTAPPVGARTRGEMILFGIWAFYFYYGDGKRWHLVG